MTIIEQLSLEQLDILRLALEADLRNELPFDEECDREITQHVHAEVLAEIRRRSS